MIRMPLKDFHESGLLWHVNATVLWPLGLALVMDHEGDDYVELFVKMTEPFEAIWSGGDAEEMAAHTATLESWMKERLAAPRVSPAE